MRPIKIRHDRICLKPFSIEWINYHSFSIVLVISGTFFCCYFVSDLIHGFWDRYWLAALLLFGAGFALYTIQCRKLKFKSIPLSGQHDGLKEQIRKLLADGGWRIEYDNQRYLQAVNRKGIPFLDCDLLILDDLGTEFPSAYVNAALYNIINTRMMAGRPTIISTNLSLKELEQRYSQRFASRVTGYYGKLEFLGKDVRVQKRLRRTKKSASESDS